MAVALPSIAFRKVEGHLNPMAVCTCCERDATQTRISRYCIAAISGDSLLCDDCEGDGPLDSPPALAGGSRDCRRMSEPPTFNAIVAETKRILQQKGWRFNECPRCAKGAVEADVLEKFTARFGCASESWTNEELVAFIVNEIADAA
jgi:hypothetical protein